MTRRIDPRDHLVVKELHLREEGRENLDMKEKEAENLTTVLVLDQGNIKATGTKMREKGGKMTIWSRRKGMSTKDSKNWRKGVGKDEGTDQLALLQILKKAALMMK